MKRMYDDNEIKQIVLDMLKNTFGIEVDEQGTVEFTKDVWFSGDYIGMHLPDEQPEDAEQLWLDGTTVKSVGE